MISDQKRFDEWIQIKDEVVRITMMAMKTPFLYNTISERINQSSGGFMIMKPIIDLQGKLAFTSIWHSSLSTRLMQDIKILPLFYEDFQIHQSMVKWMPIGGAGLYEQQLHMIALNMELGETLAFMASVFIHELGHGLAAKKASRAMTDRLEPMEYRTIEEAEIRTFDYHLMLMLGGPAYRLLAEEMAFKIMRYCTGQQKKMPLLEGTGIALDHCWGSVSGMELKTGRDNLFRLFCELMAIDRYAPPCSVQKLKCRKVAPFTEVEKV